MSNDATHDVGASVEVENEAVMPDEISAGKPKALSIRERIHAAMNADGQKAGAIHEGKMKSPPNAAQAPAKAPEKDESVDDASTVKADADEQFEDKPKTLRELSEKLGMSYEELLDGIEAETKVDGEEGTVSLSKLLKSYQLEGSLNRKSMELSEARKALELEAQSRKQHFESGLDQLRTMLDANMRLFHGEVSNLDWKQLEETDPVEFLRLRTKFDDRNRELIRHQQFLQQEQDKRDHDAALKLQKMMDEELRQLINSIPEWKDKAKAKQGHAELMEFLKTSGLGDDDISGVRNHKHALLLRDGMLYRALQAKKKDVVRQVSDAPKLSRPGAKNVNSDGDIARNKSLRAQLKATGRIPKGLLAQYLR